jgi:hypothetical protein
MSGSDTLQVIYENLPSSSAVSNSFGNYVQTFYKDSVAATTYTNTTGDTVKVDYELYLIEMAIDGVHFDYGTSYIPDAFTANTATVSVVVHTGTTTTATGAKQTIITSTKNGLFKYVASYNNAGATATFRQERGGVVIDTWLVNSTGPTSNFETNIFVLSGDLITVQQSAPASGGARTATLSLISSTGFVPSNTRRSIYVPDGSVLTFTPYFTGTRAYARGVVYSA